MPASGQRPRQRPAPGTPARLRIGQRQRLAPSTASASTSTRIQNSSASVQRPHRSARVQHHLNPDRATSAPASRTHSVGVQHASSRCASTPAHPWQRQRQRPAPPQHPAPSTANVQNSISAEHHPARRHASANTRPFNPALSTPSKPGSRRSGFRQFG
jgi:hypothetical protein